MKLHEKNMDLHGKLEHASIIPLQHAMFRANAACLIMPLVEKTLPVLNTKYLHQLVHTLKYLARKQVCHNDIKWTNIGYDRKNEYNHVLLKSILINFFLPLILLLTSFLAWYQKHHSSGGSEWAKG
jgi:serine/threonine protein kinase